MGQNTNQLEGYTVLSSLSLNGSGATLKANDIVASTLSVSGTQKIGIDSASTGSFAVVTVQAGSATAPSYAVLSEVSLGLYRSAASQLAMSYGTLNTSGFVFTKLAGSAFTIGSSATTRTITDGAFYFSVLSLTTNGAEVAFRSGNTVYKFASVAVG